MSKSSMRKMKNKFFFTHNQNDILQYLDDNPFFNFIDLHDDDGNTVLHFASNFNRLSLMQNYLLRAKQPAFWKQIEGVNLSSAAIKFRIRQWVNLKNNEGLTAMHYASLKGHIEMMKMLQKNGGNVFKTTERQKTMLHMAVQGKSLKLMLYLRGKINMNTPDDKGATPLHWSCYHGYLHIVNYLLSNSQVEINCRDQDGNTPLHIAVKFGHFQVVEALLRKGADPNIVSNEDNLPVQLLGSSTSKPQKIKKIFDQYSHNKCIPKTSLLKVPLFFLIIFIFILIRVTNQTILNIFISSRHFFPFEPSINLICEGVCFLISFILIVVLLSEKYCQRTSDFTVISKTSLVGCQEQLLKKVCFECEIIKNCSVQHCYICKKCVESRYKHSRILNKCIDKNNIRKWVIFLLFLMGYLGYICTIGTFTLLQLINNNKFVDIEQQILCYTFLCTNLIFIFPIIVILVQLYRTIRFKPEKNKKQSLLTTSTQKKSTFTSSFYVEDQKLTQETNIIDRSLQEHLIRDRRNQ